MKILIAERIRADHEEVEGIVTDGFHGIGRDNVEVHVAANRSRFVFTGKAWPEPPLGRATDPGTRFLVQIVMPQRPSRTGFPYVWKYPRLKTAPELVANCWQERLLAVAAHEAYHVKQFRMQMRRSEITAERWAGRALERLRAQEIREPSTSF
jgi:hypothetical protein